jgi:hypothetical protein
MTTSPFLDRDAFNARFAIECVDDGGVLMDLETGSYFQLNITAAQTCAILCEAADHEKATATLSARLGISSAEAAGVIAHVHGGLSRGGIRSESPSPFRYRKRGDGYVLLEGEAQILFIDLEQRRLRLTATSAGLRFKPIDYVRAVTPKLMGILGINVLHGATCILANRTVGFLGQSRAGKTSTMRAFASASATEVSEDLIVLRQDGPRPTIWTEGESRAHAWADETARDLGSIPGVEVSFEPLRATATGPSAHLDEIWFLDANRRAGDRFVRRPMGGAEGLVFLLNNAFLWADDPQVWRSHLANTRALREKLDLYETTAPHGLQELVRGAKDYATNLAS